MGTVIRTHPRQNAGHKPFKVILNKLFSQTITLFNCQSSYSNIVCFSMSEAKPTSELLSAIQTADTKDLKGVTPVENPAAKHDMTMFGVAKFDKNKLKTVETTEKNPLPTAQDIQQAKEIEKTH